MKISICIDALYSGKNFTDAMQEVANLGVKYIEFWSWWDKDLDDINEARVKLNLTVSAFCTKIISLVDASQRAAFLEGLCESIQVAKRLGCQTLIAQVGADTGAPRAEQESNLIDGLRACVPMLEKENMRLIFEPLNTTVDHAQYYLSRSDEAFRIAEQVNNPRVKVLYDIYHQQITEGQLIQTLTTNIGLIGHFHAAGNPGRHELYYGEINYPEIFKAIERTGYSGSIGFEYFPIDDPARGIREFLY